ncbi:alpha/beta hydrolase [Streptomyces piniterrae]|uniref:Alpha/beta hydrolase n=1 Tax=Streptomyces piniterrae TaxID=2571125 RepID=A0A4U0MU83_9ACTN|nr:alpha/beta hydrolase [Streptomyces piniterrae]TJZ44555.1 alpha/beta hydrolase [Streptomyces piniterrae]
MDPTAPHDEAPPPIVFVHGMRVSGTMWHPVIEHIGNRHPTAAPDLPGHGARRGEPFTMAGAVRAVDGAIDALGGRALVVGLSLGGYVSIATAASHPDRVLGVVAMGCTSLPRGLFGAAFRGAGRAAAACPEAANRLSAFGFRRTLPRPTAEAMISGGLASEVIPGVVDAVADMNPLASLAAYPGPVWLVNGGRDHFRRHERLFLRACRDGRLAVRPGCGHVTSLSDTAAVARTVLDAAAVVRAGVDRVPTPEGAADRARALEAGR